MKFVPNVVTRTVARQILVGQKHSPTILFGAGVVGVVGTAVLASRATLRLEEILDDTQNNIGAAKMVRRDRSDIYSEKDLSKDIAYIYTRSSIKIAKLYAPSIAVGALTIACLTKSHNILTKRNAALSAAYAAVDKAFSEYRSRVVEEFGEDKDRELMYRTETIKVKDEDGKTVKKKVLSPNQHSQYARFFDELCEAWKPRAEYNMLFLQCQQNYANDLLRSRGHIFLNEVYDMIGVPRSQAGSVVGWVIRKDGGGDNYVDFGIFNGDSEKAREFVNGHEGAILLDFNVDGVIYDKI